MNRKNLLRYALIAGVAAIWVGVSASTVVPLAAVLACPLMMPLMHGGGGHAGHGPRRDDRDVSVPHHTTTRRLGENSRNRSTQSPDVDPVLSPC